ncbi:MAG: hypothetical protein QOD35_3492 [Nocardioidaceae bacterium]|jgi:hypothetical protein|nr:hypothetical protein [Nocardioidaceae bacterium]
MIRHLLTITAGFCALAATPAQSAQGSFTADKAQAQLSNYLHVWSTDSGINPRSMARFYADHVIYYGKPMTRDQVLRDKLQYIRTWSQRYYRIVPGTVSTDCDGVQSVCRVKGVMQWDRRSRGGERSVGSALLSLTFSKNSGARIVQESASLAR